jgi:hypothetical protein
MKVKALSVIARREAKKPPLSLPIPKLDREIATPDPVRGRNDKGSGVFLGLPHPPRVRVGVRGNSALQLYFGFK